MSKFSFLNNTHQQIKVKLEKEFIDKFLEIIGFAFVVTLIVLPLYYFPKLPEQIPIHFNFNGEVDGYGPKYTILFFSALGVLVYIALFILSKFPHKFNYLVKITEQNAEIQYMKATRLIRKMNTIIIAMLFFIDYEIIFKSLNQQPFILAPMIYLFLLLLFIIIGHYIFSSLKNK